MNTESMQKPTSGSGRDGILRMLKAKGPMTASQLARRMRVTPAAVHQHLAKLQDDGLVQYTKEPRKRGRPAHIWELTSTASGHFPDRHADLLIGILQATRAVFGDNGTQRLTREWARLQLERYRERMPKRDASIEKRLQILARIRRGEGFMPEWRRDRDGSLEYVERHCSIAMAARSCSCLCDAELALFQAALGQDVRVERGEHLLQGGRRCGYQIVELESLRSGRQ